MSTRWFLNDIRRKVILKILHKLVKNIDTKYSIKYNITKRYKKGKLYIFLRSGDIKTKEQIRMGGTKE